MLIAIIILYGGIIMSAISPNREVQAEVQAQQVSPLPIQQNPHITLINASDKPTTDVEKRAQRIAKFATILFVSLALIAIGVAAFVATFPISHALAIVAIVVGIVSLAILLKISYTKPKSYKALAQLEPKGAKALEPLESKGDKALKQLEPKIDEIIARKPQMTKHSEERLNIETPEDGNRLRLRNKIEIPKAANRRRLRNLKKQFESKVAGAQGNLIKLNPLDKATQNPVTKLEEVSFIPINTNKNNFYYVKVSHALTTIISKTEKPEFIGLYKKLLASEKDLNKIKILLRSELEKIEASIKKDDEDDATMIFTMPEMKELRESLLRDNEPLICYKKEDIINNIKILLLKRTSENEVNSEATVKESEQLLEILKKLNDSSSTYLNLQELSQLTPLEVASLIRNAAEFIPSDAFPAEVLRMHQKLLGITKIESPAYAFKIGREHVREQLGGTILTTLGLESYYVPKTPMELQGTQLGATKNPSGIAGPWLSKGIDYPKRKWADLMDKKLELEEALFHEESYEAWQKQNSIVPQLREEIKILEEDIREFGAEESTEQMIAAGLLLCSYDDHINQVKKQEGELYNFDFARFLAPSQVVADSKGTYPTLRTFLLDHPSASEPMSEALKQKILKWNIGSIQKSFEEQGLIGTSEEFDTAYKDMSELAQYRIIINSIKNKEKLLEICKRKYTFPEPVNIKELQKTTFQGLITVEELTRAINFNDSMTVEELQKIIRLPSVRKELAIQKECFRKISPTAFIEMQKRMTSLQDYVKSTPSKETTLSGAFNVMYPLLAPFMKVLKRFESNPGAGISISYDTVQMQYKKRSLEELIALAKEKELASPQEIEEMTKALQMLKVNAPSMELLALTQSTS